MKKITILLLFLFSSTLFAQNFEKSWTKVIHFENDGKIKSANREVEKIYKKAVSNKDENQIIRCFFYKSKYLITLEENAQAQIITNLENEIEKISIPSKAILNLVYAKCLNSYSEAHQYDLYKRTKLDSINTGNFLTWTSIDFIHKINQTYTATLQNEFLNFLNKLGKVPLSAFFNV